MAIGVYAVKKSGGVKNLNIGIFGFGPIGMSVMLASKAQKAKNIYVTDLIDERLVIAGKEGAALTANPEQGKCEGKVHEKRAARL